MKVSHCHISHTTCSLKIGATPIIHLATAQATVHAWEGGEALARDRHLQGRQWGGSGAHLGDGPVPLLPLLTRLLQLASPGRLARLRPGPLFCQQAAWPLWKGEAFSATGVQCQGQGTG